MIILLKHDAEPLESAALLRYLDQQGIATFAATAYGQTLIRLQPGMSADIRQRINDFGSVAATLDKPEDYVLVSRAFRPSNSWFHVGGVPVGKPDVFNIMAGPCSVENEEMIYQTAEYLSRLGVKFLRGGAYKPRTSPYSFQGLGKDGLKLIRSAADAYGMRVVTEVIDTSLIDEITPYADILQVGSRNMQNYHFLKELGKSNKPILLKRGMFSRVEEWLMAAEYIVSNGNEKVILCERGIRSFDTILRNTMDISAIALVKELSHLPVLGDPSHGTGRADLVGPLSRACAAVGADGLLLEVHPQPCSALSDGKQSLSLEEFARLMQTLEPVVNIMHRQQDTQLHAASIKK